MIGSIASFANDSYYILRSPHSFSKKALLWLNLLHPSRRMLGFEIAHFDRPALRHLYRELFARQYYYFQSVSDSPLILDCGANIGMASLYFKWLYPNARIEAFEPDPTTFSMLNTNVARNRLSSVVTHNCALWDDNGNIDFFVDANPGSLMMTADQSRLNGKAIRVPCRKLSDFIQQPIDFLKLDVEGAESRVLSDLVSSGKVELVRQMVIEYHHHIGSQRSSLADFLSKLEQSGFEYQFHASLWPVTAKGVFQDMLIGAYRAE